MKRKHERSEKSIEQACVKMAKAKNWESRKMNGLGFRDWPDRLFIPPPFKNFRSTYGFGASRVLPKGERFWVEFKRKGKEPTPSQWKRINDLRARGECVNVIDNVEIFKEVLREQSD